MSKLCVQNVLELACSAHRKLGRYIKEGEVWIQNVDPKIPPMDLPNKWLIQSTLRLIDWPDRMPPKDLVITNEDQQLATDIQTFYRRLAFTVIANDNSFDSTVFSLLNSAEMDHNNIGFLACLPSMYFKALSSQRIEKAARTCDEEFLGAVGSSVNDLDCEIIGVVRSKNFDAWNITAIIDNKMASWLSNPELTLGPAVIVRAKIKDYSQHWLHKNCVTRLHYVKVAQ